jgi:hypothetical protein
MNGYTTCIDGSNPGWRYNNVFFLGFFTKSFRNVVFPVPAFPVKKNASVGVFYDFKKESHSSIQR